MSRCAFVHQSSRNLINVCKRNGIPIIATAFALLGWATSVAQGQILFTGNGGTSSDYSIGANWSTGAVPGTTDTTTDVAIGHTVATSGLTAIYNTPTSYTTSGRFTLGWNDVGTLTLSGSAGTLTYGTSGGDDYVGVDGGTGFLNVNAGTLVIGSNASLRIGVNGQTATGTVNVGGGTLTNNGGGGTIVLGTGGGANAGNLNISSGIVSWTNGGGTQLTNGEITVSGGTYTSTNTIDIGEGAGTGTSYTQTGGTVTTNQFVAGAHGATNTTNISGGSLNATFYVGGYGGSSGGTATVNLSGTGSINGFLDFDGGSANNGVFNLNGGSLNVNGVQNDGTGAGTQNLNFNGGTLKATGALTVGSQTGVGNNNLVLTDKAGGAVINSNSFTVTMDHALLNGGGGGGLIKQGAGTLNLTAANTFTGAVDLQGGTLEVSSAGTLGNGVGQKVLVENGTLLDMEKTLTTTDQLYVAQSTPTPELNLGAGTIFTVEDFFLDSVAQPVGLYTAANDPTLISGAGTLDVLAEVPEPSSIVALVGLCGMGFLGLVLRRRRAA